MEKTLSHVGIYDFWGIFGSGTVLLTSFLVSIIYTNNYLDSILNTLAKFESNWDVLFIFFYVICSYSIGLILHNLCSLFCDVPIIGYKVKIAVKPIKKAKFFNLFKYFRSKYIVNNDRIDATMHGFDFYKCYDYLKSINRVKRADKYHSLFGMSKVLSLGYLLLSVIFSIWIKRIEFIVAFLVLSIMFFVRSKKYFYKWIEWVFIDYQHCKKHYIRRKRK